MKIFQTVLSNYAILGINREQSKQPILSNRKVLMGILIGGLTITSILVYIFDVANSSREYIECVTTLFAVIIIAIYFLAVAFKMSELFENIDCMENAFEMSEWLCILNILFWKME